MASIFTGTLALLSVFSSVSAAPTSQKQSLAKRDSIPDYALTYAPYHYLYSGEGWFCSDIATHVKHMSIEYDFVNVSTSVTLETLLEYNSSTYMTSYDNVEDNPAWLLSAYGIPDDSGYSAAPATIIAADKTIDGVDYVDVFYFFFYSYNHGPKVLGTRYDNHVGDWEHAMIRFSDGKPKYVYLSAHDSGAAYEYSAMDMNGVRPITYSATGSHANYATTGSHEIYLELGYLASDTTDAGYFWDVTQNYRGYWYDNSTDSFTSAGGVSTGATEQVAEGVNWLSWLGKWGDEQYPKSDPRQECLADLVCHYQTGPTGPVDKNLGRTTPCENDKSCTIQTSL